MSDDGVKAGLEGNGNGAGGVRIGVFICHCGGNISDVVDVKWVARQMRGLPGVVYSETHTFMCSDPAQAMIEEKIKELGLNRVIVAACSPTLHALTFRRTLERAGLNQYLFEHVNVREQVSWVVEDPRGGHGQGGAADARRGDAYRPPAYHWTSGGSPCTRRRWSSAAGWPGW